MSLNSPQDPMSYITGYMYSNFLSLSQILNSNDLNNFYGFITNNYSYCVQNPSYASQSVMGFLSMIDQSNRSYCQILATHPDPCAHYFLSTLLFNLSENDKKVLLTKPDSLGESLIDYCMHHSIVSLKNLLNGMNEVEQSILIFQYFKNRPYNLVNALNIQVPGIRDFIKDSIAKLSQSDKILLLTQRDHNRMTAIEYCLNKGTVADINSLFDGLNDKNRQEIILKNFEKEPFKLAKICGQQNSIGRDYILNTLTNLDNDEKLKFLTEPVLGNSSVMDIFLDIDPKFIEDLFSNLEEREKKEIIYKNFYNRYESMARALDNGSFDNLMNALEDGHDKNDIINIKKVYMLKKMAGHFMGISATNSNFNSRTNTFQGSEKNSESQYEGLLFKLAMSMFKEKLKTYTPSVEFRSEFKAIMHAFECIEEVDVNNRQIDKQLEKYVREYSNANLIVIPTGWEKHSVTVAATSEYLIIANRGTRSNDLKGGCTVYRLNAPLTEDAIFSLMKKTTEYDFEKIVQSIVKKKDDGAYDIFYSFNQIKDQSHGTCSIANKKAVVAGILLLLKGQGQVNDGLVNSCMEEYKKLTTHIRQIALNELTSELRDNLDLKNDLLEIFSDFCNQHLDVTKKKELTIIMDIISNIPDSMKAEFNSLLSMEALWIISKLDEGGIDYPFSELLKDCNFYRLTQYSYDKTISFTRSLILLIENDTSITEAFKWCSDYFDYILGKKNFKILFSKLTILAEHDKSLLIKAFLEYGGSRCKKLITLMQQNGNDQDLRNCVELIFRDMSINEKVKLLSPEYTSPWLLRTIQSGDLLEMVLDGLDLNQIVELFSVVDNYIEDDNLYKNVLDAKHDVSFYQVLYKKIGPDHFKTLIEAFPDCITNADAQTRQFIESRITASKLDPVILKSDTRRRKGLHHHYGSFNSDLSHPTQLKGDPFDVYVKDFLTKTKGDRKTYEENLFITEIQSLLEKLDAKETTSIEIINTISDAVDAIEKSDKISAEVKEQAKDLKENLNRASHDDSYLAYIDVKRKQAPKGA